MKEDNETGIFSYLIQGLLKEEYPKGCVMMLKFEPDSNKGDGHSLSIDKP